ncbi:hypothetical protein P7K49_010271 [Saguinus oedipus]|uniref:polynucleotide adenylyltransferase n=1 Tax=Saguinus oedipus TaxID=9490 RepID=A0ABQ9VMB1_SAGOE|nr:hypothetical protein P7K49_010271 [Saguinus oedipus]
MKRTLLRRVPAPAVRFPPGSPLHAAGRVARLALLLRCALPPELGHALSRATPGAALTRSFPVARPPDRRAALVPGCRARDGRGGTAPRGPAGLAGALGGRGGAAAPTAPNGTLESLLARSLKRLPVAAQPKEAAVQSGAGDYLLGIEQLRRLYCNVLPDGRIGGAHADTRDSLLELSPVEPGVVSIFGVASRFFVAISSKGKLYGSPFFTTECKFREILLLNYCNAYESYKYPSIFIALKKNGKTKNGNRAVTLRKTPASSASGSPREGSTLVHFLHRGDPSTDVRALQRYLCFRFFTDFSHLVEQRRTLERYLEAHFRGADAARRYSCLVTLHRVVNESTVCLMNHERRQTLGLIVALALQALAEQGPAATAALAWRPPGTDRVVLATVNYYVTPVQPLLARAYPTWLPCN